MQIDVVKTHVIHRSHELCTGRLPIFVGELQGPCLVLSRCKSVAECNPLCMQIQLRVGSTDIDIVTMEHTVFHPRISHCDAIEISLFVFEGTCVHLVIQREGAAFKHLTAR